MHTMTPPPNDAYLDTIGGLLAIHSAGVWTRDMKMRTNLAQPQITKILKTLEGRGLIKAVKNVNNPSRKHYMISELTPSREITGGAW